MRNSFNSTVYRLKIVLINVFNTGKESVHYCIECNDDIILMFKYCLKIFTDIKTDTGLNARIPMPIPK